MQPSYRQFSANNISLRAGQLQHDNMLPPEDPPEPPEMEGEIGDLMVEQDTDLVTYAEFKDSADECLFDMVPEGFLVELILAASRCSDPFIRDRVRDARRKLEDHAGAMLDSAWRKRMEGKQ